MDATRSPGWYPAPDGNGQQWWNGAGWSESRKPVTPTVVRQPSIPPAVPQVPRMVYSASRPAPQSPSESPEFGGTIPAAAQVDARANPAAMYALIAGVVAIVFNVLLVPSILAIVFASSGIKRSRELAAAGHANTMRALSVTGLVLGIFGAVSAVIPVVVFIVTLVSGTTAAYSG